MKITDYIKSIPITYIIISLLIIINIILLYKCANNKKTQEMFGDSATTNNVKNSQETSNYDDEIVLYYASWCGYSRSFLPEWEKFSKWVLSDAKNIKVTSVRCESGNENVCIEKGIRGYPTVVLYPKEGTEVMFNGERTADALKEFVTRELKTLSV